MWNPINSREVQSLFYLCVSPLCCLLILLYRCRSDPQLCCCPQLTCRCTSLGDVHRGHTHAEPLHLQSQEQRHKGGFEKIPWDSSYKRNNRSEVEELFVFEELKASEPETCGDSICLLYLFAGISIYFFTISIQCK